MAERRSPAARSSGGGAIRCAIYTRKSTEEGLEQEFNSLDAQYDACSAYVASQRHEGWTLVRERYDDGGFSGGNLERPGLKRLLADIAAGKVDVVILYKIDRLTRSLSDFARIVEVLDKAEASFVSVTQSFNTTTSMGRLTLNMLLSFAQFEREVTAERIRDKIAASKARGIWMGGPVPLGYRVLERKLLIDEADAQKVRHIFRRYLELGSGQALLDELRADGYRTRRQQLSDGSIRGGIPFQRGSLFHLLRNRIYLGEVVHKGTAYPGEHPPIIDRELWDAVQALIEANSVKRATGENIRAPSLLAGVIRDGLGRKMTPSHTLGHGRRYRYYITHASAMTDEAPAWRIAAHEVEATVIARLTELLKDRIAIFDLVGSSALTSGQITGQLSTAIAAGASIAERMSNYHHRRMTVMRLVHSVSLGSDSVRIGIDTNALAELIGLQGAAEAETVVHLTAPLVRPKMGRPARLILGATTNAADPALVNLLVEARAARAAVLDQPTQSIKAIADASGRCRHRLARLVKLSWLAPNIVAMIIKGEQPVQLDARTLLRAKLPLDWAQQKVALGID